MTELDTRITLTHKGHVALHAWEMNRTNARRRARETYGWGNPNPTPEQLAARKARSAERRTDAEDRACNTRSARDKYGWGNPNPTPEQLAAREARRVRRAELRKAARRG